MLEPFRDGLEAMVNWMSEAFKSGEMQKASALIGSSLGVVFEDIKRFFTGGKDYIKDWADYFVFAMKGIIIWLAIVRFNIMQMKLVLLIVKEAWAIFATALNTILSGITGSIDEAVQHFKWVVDNLPSFVPGIATARKAFAVFGEFTATVAKAQTENLAIVGQMAVETGTEILKISTTSIGDIVADASYEFDKLLSLLL